MKEKLEKIKNEILGNLAKVKTLDDWQNLEVKYLGRKGIFTEIEQEFLAAAKTWMLISRDFSGIFRDYRKAEQKSRLPPLLLL